MFTGTSLADDLWNGLMAAEDGSKVDGGKGGDVIGMAVDVRGAVTLTGGSGSAAFGFMTRRNSAGGDDAARGRDASQNDLIEIAGASMKDGSTAARRGGDDARINYTLVDDGGAETGRAITAAAGRAMW